jgi:hypothetical protein
VYGILPKIKKLYQLLDLNELIREYDAEYSTLLTKFYHVKDFLQQINRGTIIAMYKDRLLQRDLSSPEQEMELRGR